MQNKNPLQKLYPWLGFAVFWAMVIIGISVAFTGLVLKKPIFQQPDYTMTPEMYQHYLSACQH